MPSKLRYNRTSSVLGRVFIIGVSVIALSACGHIGEGKHPKKASTPVVGNRTSILSSNQAVAVDPEVEKVPVTLPAAELNADWAQPGGDSSKAVGNVQLGRNLSELWSQNVQGGGKRARLASEPVISGGRLFVIDTDATVHAFDARTGAPIWDTNVQTKGDNSHAEFGGGVSVAGDRIFATTGVGDVVALSAANGKELWKKRPGGPLRGSATVNNGHLYVMSQDNQIYALSQEDGTVVWQDGGTIQSTSIFGVAAPAASQGTVIAGFSSGELTAYRYENGRVLWGDALSRTSISTTVAALTDIDADPVIDRGRVFAIGQGGRMASYELVTGQRLWEINIAGVATPVVSGDWVFVVTDNARLISIQRATGKIRWITQLKAYHNDKKRTGIVRWHGPLLGDGRLLLVSTDGDLTDVDAESGDVRSHINIGKDMSLPPVAAGGILYILTDEGRIIAYK
jgi:outer membrane protein assembly factor BamB